MKKTILFAGTLALFLFTANKVYGQKSETIRPADLKQKKTIYFNPEIYPNVEEIKEATNQAFFSAVSDKIKDDEDNKMIKADSPMEYDNISVETIEEYCKNNDADFAIVPKVKFFKVGIGKYVFSSQVVVSMKLYDANGNFITESDFDTFKKDRKILGSAENFIKVGTEGAMTALFKKLRKLKIKAKTS